MFNLNLKRQLNKVKARKTPRPSVKVLVHQGHLEAGPVVSGQLTRCSDLEEVARLIQEASPVLN